MKNLKDKESGKILGVTGVPGSGKSTVAAILKDLGLPCVDADLEAHSLYHQSQELRTLLAQEFGYHILQGTNINRKVLGKIVFEDSQKMEKLNNLVQPFLWDSIQKKLKDFQEQMKWIVLDAALLVEWNHANDVDVLWVVVSSEEKRIQRFATRMGISKQEAKERSMFQMSQKEKMTFADTIINNDESVESLRTKVEKEFAELNSEG